MDPIEERRSKIVFREYDLFNAYASDFPGKYPGYDDSWNFQRFKDEFEIRMVKRNSVEMQFDVVHLNVAIVNSLRRILLSEVPTMAIDKVFVYNNTSIIPDEILCHRLGLIPINADPRVFEYRQEGDDTGTPEDTIEFSLKIKCTKNASAPKDATDPQELYQNSVVYSKHLQWVPLGSQKELCGENAFNPIHDDILIAQLRQGHELDLKLHCVKGIGKDHAKFSPVATASYRFLPEIELTKEVNGELAYKLASTFPQGVIDVVDKDGEKVAKVANARMDTCSRNYLRHDDLRDCVKMTAAKEHLIFSIESTGALPPDTLFVEAIKVLMGKCKLFIAEIDTVAASAAT